MILVACRPRGTFGDTFGTNQLVTTLTEEHHFLLPVVGTVVHIPDCHRAHCPTAAVTEFHNLYFLSFFLSHPLRGLRGGSGLAGEVEEVGGQGGGWCVYSIGTGQPAADSRRRT